MKRIYVATAFLSIIIGLCIFEQIYIDSFYKASIELTDKAIEYTDNNDYENAYTVCKELYDYWQKKYPYLTSMVEHGVVNDAGNLIEALPELAKTKNEALRMELTDTKNQITIIRDVEKPKLENIF